MPFQPGVSGNPRGRPKKGATLTDILARAGSRMVPDGEDRRIAKKRLVARMLWDALMTGYVPFPEGPQPVGNWLDLVEFVYNRIDGKPAQSMAMDVTSQGRALSVREVIVNLSHEPEPEPVEG